MAKGPASRVFLVALLLHVLPPPAARSQEIEWLRQFGTNSFDQALAVAVDGSSVYVAGQTEGALPDQTRNGSFDAFVRKYDAAGTELWTRQFGATDSATAFAAAADASGVYVAGTALTISGETFTGGFVRKYDAAGTELWTRLFPTAGGSTRPFAVAADASGIYVAGEVFGRLPGQTSAGDGDAFVRKYNANGEEQWTRQFGTGATDGALAVAVDASGVYVAGQTIGTFPGEPATGTLDAFVRKYDAEGNAVWTRQFGSNRGDRAFAVAVDASGVYVAGEAGDALPGQTAAGLSDAFVRKYDAAGTEEWTRQFGSNSFNQARGVAADASGVYVAGEAQGALPGQTSTGNAFVRKYDAAGTEQWTRLLTSTGGSARAFAVAADVSAVYVAGDARDSLPGQTPAGGVDAFVVKLLAQSANNAPEAQAGPDQTVECSRHGGTPITLDGSASFDADGDTLTFEWVDANGNVVGSTAVVNLPLPLGVHQFTLTVSDGQGGTETDSVTVAVRDTTPPVITAALVPVGKVENDEGVFRVVFSSSDRCDAGPTSAAHLNGIAVAHGQVVELERNDDEQEVESEDGVLEIEAPSFVLTVTGIDGEGNRGGATVTPVFATKNKHHWRPHHGSRR